MAGAERKQAPLLNGRRIYPLPKTAASTAAAEQKRPPLLKAGASKTGKDNAGRTPGELAASSEVQKLLR